MLGREDDACKDLEAGMCWARSGGLRQLSWQRLNSEGENGETDGWRYGQSPELVRALWATHSEGPEFWENK